MLGIIVAILYFIFGIFTVFYFSTYIISVQAIQFNIRKQNEKMTKEQFNHLKHIIYFWSVVFWPALFIFLINDL